MIETSEWRWTPQDVAALPVPQLLTVFREPVIPNPETALKQVNAVREQRGLPPLNRLPGMKRKR